MKVQLSVLDLVSDAKTHEGAYKTAELQMFPRGENLPNPAPSTINLTVDQPQAVNAQQRPEGPFTGPF